MGMGKILLASFGTFTGLFAIYSQCMLGNIWYRPDDSGTKTFQPQSLLRLMASPFIETTLWDKSVLDLNYIVFTGSGMILSTCAYLYGSRT